MGWVKLKHSISSILFVLNQAVNVVSIVLFSNLVKSSYLSKSTICCFGKWIADLVTFGNS